eukprot:symbB.v1.2.036599.t1/scaffold5201.1/size46531/1
MAEISSQKGVELEKAQKEIQALKKQLAFTTARLTRAQEANRGDGSLEDLPDHLALQDSMPYTLSLEEAELLQMRAADHESSVLSAQDRDCSQNVQQLSIQDLDETAGTIMTIPSAIEQREDGNVEALQNALQELQVAERQRKEANRRNRTLQNVIDTVHKGINEERKRCESTRHEARRARSEVVVLRHLLGQLGQSKETSDSGLVAKSAAVEHQLQEARKSHEIAESLPGDEAEVEQKQPALLQEKDSLQQQLQQAQQAQMVAQQTVAEKETQLEEALKRAEELEEEKQVLQAEVEQKQPALLQEKDSLQQQLQQAQQAQVVAQQTVAEKETQLEEESARALQLEEDNWDKENKINELKAQLKLMKERFSLEKEQEAEASEDLRKKQLEDLKQQMQSEAQQYAASLQELARKEIERLRAEMACKDEQVDSEVQQKTALQQQLHMFSLLFRTATVTNGKQEKNCTVKLAVSSLAQVQQAERERQMQLEEALAHARQLEEEKRRVQESYNDMQAEALKRAEELEEEKQVLQAEADQLRKKQLEDLKQQMQSEAQQYAASLQELARKEIDRFRAEMACKDEQVNSEVQQKTALQHQLQEAVSSLAQVQQAERERQMQLEEALAHARQLEEEKRRVQESYNDMQVQLQQSQPAFREENGRLQLREALQESPPGPASFDISTPRSHRSAWADSPEERRPDDAI